MLNFYNFYNFVFVSPKYYKLWDTMEKKYSPDDQDCNLKVKNIKDI